MLDTNVLISMVFFPTRSFTEILKFISAGHTLVISSYNIEEMVDVTERKFPAKRNAIDRFLMNLSYEMVYTPHWIEEKLVKIRDVKDYPVLYTAIVENVDVLITGA